MSFGLKLDLITAKCAWSVRFVFLATSYDFWFFIVGHKIEFYSFATVTNKRISIQHLSTNGPRHSSKVSQSACPIAGSVHAE